LSGGIRLFNWYSVDFTNRMPVGAHGMVEQG
jgi:lipoprotein-anchoring transpeptidase ErfK/SrfK